MTRLLTISLCLLVASTVRCVGDDVKQLNTTKGLPVLVANIANPNPDCSTNSGFIGLPIITLKPEHGSIVLKTIDLEVPASGACPVRKVPGIAVIFAPGRDFIGDDHLSLILTLGERSIERAYAVAVK